MAKKKENTEVIAEVKNQPVILPNGLVAIILNKDGKIYEVSKKHAEILVNKGRAKY